MSIQMMITRKYFARSMQVSELNWIGFDVPASSEFEAHVQVRYHHQPVSARIHVDGARAEVVFDEPQLAVAPGQGAAFYRGDRLLGGGWIASTALAGVRAMSGEVGHA